MLSIYNQKGFGLIETLIALLLVSIGLLGMAKLINFNVLNNQLAYQKTVATILVYDMAERIKLNSTQKYSVLKTEQSTQIMNVECDLNMCDSQTLKKYDQEQWLFLINEKLPFAHGIVEVSNNIADISIFWNAHSATKKELESIQSINIQIGI